MRGNLHPPVGNSPVANVLSEALAAKRPYRQERTTDEALTIIDRQTGRGLCPTIVSALKTFLAETRFVPYQVAA